MKELNLMEKDMGLALFSIVREASMLEIGNKIKCMEKVRCIILVRRLHMRGNGRMISFRGMVFCTMKKSPL